MERLKRLLGLPALLAGELAAIGVLHRLGDLPWLAVRWEDPAAWLATAPAEDAVMMALRLAALAGAYWLAVTTACYTLARAARLPAAVRSVQWATLPAVRRVADRAVAVALASSSVAVGVPGLAAATVVVPPAVSGPATLPGDPTAPPAVAPGDRPAVPGDRPAVPGDPTAVPGDPTAPPAVAALGAATHVVVPGDNLWDITAGALGGEASNEQVHARWLAVIEENRGRLRSGDPDLIYPGEQVVLPPP